MFRQDRSILTNQPCRAVDGGCGWSTHQQVPFYTSFSKVSSLWQQLYTTAVRTDLQARITASVCVKLFTTNHLTISTENHSVLDLSVCSTLQAATGSNSFNYIWINLQAVAISHKYHHDCFWCICHCCVGVFLGTSLLMLLKDQGKSTKSTCKQVIVAEWVIYTTAEWVIYTTAEWVIYTTFTHETGVRSHIWNILYCSVTIFKISCLIILFFVLCCCLVCFM